MKSKSLSEKGLYFISMYYFIVMIFSSFQFLYFIVIHLFSNDPSHETIKYIYQFFWFSFYLLLIYCNYQIVFKEKRKSYLVINLIFSGMQLISFHISNIYYFTSFGLYYGILLGFRNGFEFHTVLYLFKTVSTLKYVDTTEYQFIAFSFLAFFAFIVFLISLLSYKKINFYDNNISSPQG
jgi:hypothetical protein